MANHYRSVLESGGGVQPTGDAVAADVLTGKTFSNANAVGISGTMPNRGAVSGQATPSQPYTIPAGYHNGSGTVTAESSAPTTFSIENISNGVAKTYSNKKGAILVVEMFRSDTAWSGDNQYTVSGMTLIQQSTNVSSGIPVALGGSTIHVQRTLYQITANNASFTTPTYPTCNTLIE